jgi:hypothetical protein
MHAGPGEFMMVLASLFLLLLVIDLYGLLLLRRHDAFARWQPVPDLSSVVTIGQGTATEEQAPDVERNARRLLKEVMDSVPKVGADPGPHIATLEAHVRRGGGLCCAGMAELYLHRLAGHGIPARKVVLKRNPFDIYDTHTTVEVAVGGRWVLFDPTFHVSFTKDGRLLGAEEVMNAVSDRSLPRVQPVFHGEVRYPARLETYYLPWPVLFNNVFIVASPRRSFLAKLPPLRYWFGPVCYYRRHTDQEGWHLGCQRSLYRLFVAVLPATLLALAVLLLYHVAKVVSSSLVWGS